MATFQAHRTITADSFAMLCFLALMQNGEGLLDKSPDYITEKTWLLHGKEASFGALDINNMRVVAEYCKRWGINMPPQVEEEYRLQEEAYLSLREKGMNI